MKIYQPYIAQIQKAIELGAIQPGIYDLQKSNEYRIMTSYVLSEEKSLQPKTGLLTLADLLGIKDIRPPYKGDHPDFAKLRETGGFDYHYIVSMFIDVQGSTNFHRKYSLEQISLIIQTIVIAATRFCSNTKPLQVSVMNLLRAISKRLTLIRLIAVSATWSVFCP